MICSRKRPILNEPFYSGFIVYLVWLNHGLNSIFYGEENREVEPSTLRNAKMNIIYLWIDGLSNYEFISGIVIAVLAFLCLDLELVLHDFKKIIRRRKNDKY